MSEDHPTATSGQKRLHDDDGDNHLHKRARSGVEHLVKMSSKGLNKAQALKLLDGMVQEGAKDLLLWQRDYGKGKKFLVATRDDMWNLIEHMSPQNRDVYEQRYCDPVGGGEPTKPVFPFIDIDRYLFCDEEKWNDPTWQDALRKYTARKLQDALIGLFARFNVVVLRTDFRISDSSRVKVLDDKDQKKLKTDAAKSYYQSLHLVIRNQACVFESMKHLGSSKDNDKYTFLNKHWSTLELPFDFDAAPYGSGAWRTLYNSKLGKRAVARPLDTDGNFIKGPPSKQLWLEHSIHWNAQQPPLDNDHNVFQVHMPATVTRAPKSHRRAKSAKTDPKAETATTVHNDLASDDTLIAPLVDYIEGLEEFKNARVRKVIDEGDVIIFNTYSKYCLATDRYHTSNHVYFLAAKQGLQQRCHGGPNKKCKGNHTEWYPWPCPRPLWLNKLFFGRPHIDCVNPPPAFSTEFLEWTMTPQKLSLPIPGVNDNTVSKFFDEAPIDLYASNAYSSLRLDRFNMMSDGYLTAPSVRILAKKVEDTQEWIDTLEDVQYADDLEHFMKTKGFELEDGETVESRWLDPIRKAHTQQTEGDDVHSVHASEQEGAAVLPLSEWSHAAVLKWLDSEPNVVTTDVVAHFKTQQVNGADLCDFSLTDLNDIGFKNRIDRKRFMRRIVRLKSVGVDIGSVSSETGLSEKDEYKNRQSKSVLWFCLVSAMITSSPNQSMKSYIEQVRSHRK